MEQQLSEAPTLLSKTQQLLKTSGKPYRRIYDDTGLSLNWLSRLANNSCPDPSVNKVQKLYEYLSGTKLTV